MGPNEVLNFLLEKLGLVYGIPWVAPFVVLPLMLLAAAYFIVEAERKTRPYLNEARKRTKALRTALGDEAEAVAERASFSRNFADASAAMQSGNAATHSFVQAWREFLETVIDETASPIRNTARPSAFFTRVAPRQAKLVFWSNVFVGLGLILTFLGLVVALNTAAKGMSVGGPNAVAASKVALVTLLTVAGAKFFTSIAGIGASLILRFAEHGLSRRVSIETDAVCSLLERGMLFISPQQLAADQLAVLREQRDELKSFNTDLALQISEHVGVQFQTVMAPVATSLSQLNENISTMGEGLGQGAAKAVAEASGGELRALGQTLATLGERLYGLSAVVGSSGDDAARQIRAAGADFAQAAADIREAFDKLASQVDGMGGKLVEQGELAAQAQTASLERVLGGLEAAQARSSDAMAEAVRSLQGAGAAAAETMQREVGAALVSGVEESQRTFRTAVEESGEGLRSAAANLSGAVGAAADQIERASTGFERGGESAGRAAQSLDEVAANARSVATSIGDASAGFTTAAAPVAQAAQAISDAAGRIQRAIDGGRELDAEATRGLIALAEEIRATQAAAQGAWQDYRARFENVDKALATTTGELATTLGNTFGEFSLFAGKVDRELGAAVTKLSDALSAIHDYAEALDDYVEVTARVQVEAAE